LPDKRSDAVIHLEKCRVASAGWSFRTTSTRSGP
jgi:hypothetical protein